MTNLIRLKLRFFDVKLANKMNNQILRIDDILNLNVFDQILENVYNCIVNRNLVQIVLLQNPPPVNIVNHQVNANVYLSVQNQRINHYMDVLNQNYNNLNNAQIERLNVIHALLNNANN